MRHPVDNAKIYATVASAPVEDRGCPFADGLLGVAEAVDCGREDGVDVGPEGDPEALDQQAAHVQAVLRHLKMREDVSSH